MLAEPVAQTTGCMYVEMYAEMAEENGKENGMGMTMSDTELAKLLDCLRQRGQTVTTVESCTGGLLAGRITDIPGSSDVFRQGFVTYCDEAKRRLVNVRRDTLERYTAVSEQTAGEMAAGGAAQAGAQACLSVTGYAGSAMEDGKAQADSSEEPDDSPEETGLVYIGCYYLGNVRVRELHLKGSRRQIREQAVDAALRLLEGCLLCS